MGINRGLVETEPGVVNQYIEEVMVTGQLRSVGTRWSQHGMNDTVKAKHVLSVVTPEDSDVDFTEVVYITWRTKKWSVTAIEYKRPRIELTLGGLYNG